MEITEVIVYALSAFSLVLGWFARELYHAVQQLRTDLTTLEVKLGTDYVRYDRLQDALKPILSAINDVKDTLARKADK
jgi:cell division protein FtsB